MYSLQLAKELVRELWKNKFRTIMSLFGIFWGTVSVILMLALGDAFYAQSEKNLSSIAGGAIMFFPGVTDMSYNGYPAGMIVNLKSNVVMNLPREISEVSAVSPALVEPNVEMATLGKTSHKSVSGVSSEYIKIWKLQERVQGRFFNKRDENNRAKEVFLGDEIAKGLFGSKDPIGKKMTIWGIPFVVIGVLKPGQGTGGTGGWLQNRAFIPYTTFIGIKGNENVLAFYVLPKDVAYAPIVTREVRQVIGGQLHFSPKDQKALNSPNLTKMLSFFTMFYKIIQVFLAGCGVMTLTVGGIGVANMMFLIVTERTREIGLRIALGAESKHIIMLVMLETLIIVATAGILAFVVADMMLWVLSLIDLPSWIGAPKINWNTATITVIILCLLTLLAGVFPARRAAKMEPVEALSF